MNGFTHHFIALILISVEKMSPLLFFSLDVPYPCHERQKHSSDLSSRLEIGVERLP